MGVGKSSIYKILRGDTRKITVSFAKKINIVYPQYTVENLLRYNYDTNSTPENEIKNILLEKDGITLTVEEIALFVLKNEEEFMSIRAFSNMVEVKVAKKVLEITSSKESLLNYIKS